MRVFILFFCVLFLTACNDNNSLCLNGNGEIVSKDLDIENIHSIELDISADILIRESATQRVEISAQQNIIDEILQHSVVSQGVWQIKVNRNCIISEDIRFFIDIPEIKMLSVDGSGIISNQGVFENIENLDLDIDGSGSIHIDLQSANKVLAIIDGSGNIKLSEGTADELIIDVDGSGDIDAFGLTAEDCNVSIDGSGDVEIFVNQNLDVEIDGSGDLCYRGNPIVTSSIEGSGSINDCN